MPTQFDDEKQNKQLEDLRKQEEEELVEILAGSKYNLPYINLASLGIDNEALRALPEKEAREMNVGCFKLSGKNIFIAVRSPSPDLLGRITDEMTRKELVPAFYMASTLFRSDSRSRLRAGRA